MFQENKESTKHCQPMKMCQENMEDIVVNPRKNIDQRDIEYIEWRLVD